MDIRQLEAFVAVIDTRSFSKAAAKLYLTQPTVSAHVLSLERELGIKLITRTTKSLSPSIAGSQFYGYAKQILDLRNQAIAAMQGLSQELKGALTIAASTIPDQYYLPQVLRSFREQNPDVSFAVSQCDSSEVIAKLLARKVDLGLCGTKPESDKCSSYVFAEDSLVVITPNREPYRSFPTQDFPLSHFYAVPIISREEGSGTRREAELFLQQQGVDLQRLNRVVETRSNESILKMVSEGMGIAILSKAAAADYVQFGKLLPFSFGKGKLQRKLYLVRLKNEVQSPVAQAFCDYARKYYHK